MQLVDVAIGRRTIRLRLFAAAAVVIPSVLYFIFVFTWFRPADAGVTSEYVFRWVIDATKYDAGGWLILLGLALLAMNLRRFELFRRHRRTALVATVLIVNALATIFPTFMWGHLSFAVLNRGALGQIEFEPNTLIVAIIFVLGWVELAISVGLATRLFRIPGSRPGAPSVGS